jgi:asparagine synthase (glutamine-hydrolysing)
MCGIVALHAPRGQVSSSALRAGSHALRHRGPDGTGAWISDDRRIGLAHTRLAIIDLATGQQPLASDDGAVHLTMNGEFYGYEVIRDELRGRGHVFRTSTDAEILLHLYKERGTDCLDRLRGDFAFVLWDDHDKRVFAARDRFGVKPLFYAIHDGILFLASEVKALLAAGVPAAWDREQVYQLISLGVPLPGRSLFKGVHQVPPGHYLLATDRGIRLFRYWDLDYPSAKRRRARTRGDDRAFIERFGAALDEAVRIRLRADVPVACYLSGGLDSSAVLGLAARHGGQSLPSFTIAFDAEGLDESQVAAETARRVGADWHPVRIGQRELAENFEAAAWHSETAFRNAHGVALFVLSERVRRAGYKVVLTGQGADEVLAGYAMFRGRPAGSMPWWMGQVAAHSRRRRGLLDPGFAEEFAGHDAYAALLARLDGPGQLEGRTRLIQAMYLWTRSVLPNYVLNVGGDRMEMAHAVEGRLPFLDHPVAELLRDMPDALRGRAPAKYVLREAARPVLTDAVYRGRKREFTAPAAVLEPAQPLYRRLEAILLDGGLASLPFYDEGKVRPLLAGLPRLDPARRVMLDPLLMQIASLCVLHERFRLQG